MFQKVDAYAGDPILSLMERFKEDPRSDKVNLSIGLYYNEDGIIPQLQAVADAEARLNAQPHGASLYLPMEGLNSYRHAIAPLLFGADHPVLKQKPCSVNSNHGWLRRAEGWRRFFLNATSRSLAYGLATRHGKTTSPYLKGLGSK